MAFMHVETQTKKLDNKAWEGRLVGCIGNSKSFRIYNPATWKVLERRKFIRIETPSISPDLSLGVDLCDDLSGYFTYEKPEDFLRDIRDYPSRLDTNTPRDFDGGNKAQQLIIDA